MTPVTRSPWGDHSAVSGPSHRFWHQSVATTHHKVPEELDTRGEACGVELTLQVHLAAQQVPPSSSRVCASADPVLHQRVRDVRDLCARINHACEEPVVLHQWQVLVPADCLHHRASVDNGGVIEGVVE